MNINVVDIIFMIPALLMAVIFHEVAHGFVAYKLGDDTAKREGRLTLNPIPHIDPLGSLLIPGILILLNSPILFGYAKPVPINPLNFKIDMRKGIIITSFAGPGTNFLLAFLFAGLYHFMKNETFLTYFASIFGTASLESVIIPLAIFFKYAVSINLILGIFNLLPIPPLDGGNILLNFLPRELQEKIEPYEQFGFFLIILLLMTGIIGLIILPIYRFFITILM
ncbi:site-2 protease family protein [Sulfurihydrogenibium subterraneum]|uniref:site-2 protease family protein n=1 Tax=Sulfurihydrogenibium subterraneum TaxID=171121 RepID=UPI000687B1DB|nr:site-2 protease family protein [Sulfurihydrogenibium subterraneum]